jgi:hypothetical protein
MVFRDEKNSVTYIYTRIHIYIHTLFRDEKKAEREQNLETIKQNLIEKTKEKVETSLK